MFINPCKNNEKHFPLNNKASYPKLSKPSNNIYSTKLQLPILLIKWAQYRISGDFSLTYKN